MLSSRDRVLCALNHEEPDRVPIFFGASGATTLLAAAYDRFKAYLGLQSETQVWWRGMQYAYLDEEVMQRFGSDGRLLLAGPVPSTLERDLPDGSFFDSWGIHWRREPGCAYYEIAENPLAYTRIEDLASYPWPDLGHPSRFVGLKEQARKIQQAGYAVVALSSISPFEYSYILRGVERWFMDLGGDPDFATALMRQVAEVQKAGAVRLLEEAGEYIDVLVMGDDLGSQSGPLISPAMYRKLIKPLHAELIQTIKARTHARVFYHSDGGVYPFLNDLVEIGVDLLNPVQVSARGMGDTARLKKEFGSRLSFCGGIDTQEVLPLGSPADVRREVRRRIHDLAPGGGYILAAVHCIQPDVPPENIIAMLEEAQTAGRYPLAL